jgi:hypothetical protein
MTEALEGSSGPMDAKSAKAEAKASAARAKALRPWYKKKRFWLLGIVVIVIAAAAAGSGSKTTTTVAPGAGGNKSPAGCVAKPPSYPGQQATDCVALPNKTVSLANTVVSAKWTKSTDNLGTPSICAAISIKNNNSSTISYNDLYWTLQSPAGKVTDTNFAASNDLGSGSIVGGGVATGNVCFDNPGQSGTYVGIYQPDFFNGTRGIWLFSLT